MKRSVIFFLVLFALTKFNFSYCQEKGSLVKVTDRLYMITGVGGNISFLTTNEGVLLIDAGSVPSDAIIIKEMVQSVTDKPIKYLVFTHYHYDHTFGACGLNDEFVIIGHENVSKNLKTLGEATLNNYRTTYLPGNIKKLKAETDSLKSINSEGWYKSDSSLKVLLKRLEESKKTKILYPDITFKQKMTIYLDTDTIELVFPGHTHTNGNIILLLKNQNAVVTGDFFFNARMPYIDFEAGCDTKNWIDQINKFASSEYKFIIPGHGDLATISDLLKQAEYLTDLRNEVKSFVDQKKSMDETLNELKMPKYSDYGFQFMLSREIEAVYKEFTER